MEADQYVVATGSAPRAPPIDGLAEAGYLTSTTAMELQQLPASLIVVGGNYVRLELAQLFAHLGTWVTVVEALDRLAPAEEPEISEVIKGYSPTMASPCTPRHPDPGPLRRRVRDRRPA